MLLIELWLLLVEVSALRPPCLCVRRGDGEGHAVRGGAAAAASERAVVAKPHKRTAGSRGVFGP